MFHSGFVADRPPPGMASRRVHRRAPRLLLLSLGALFLVTAGCSAMFVDAARQAFRDPEIKANLTEMGRATAKGAVRDLFDDPETKKHLMDMATAAAKGAAGPGTPWGQLMLALVAALTSGGVLQHKMQTRDRRKYHGEKIDRKG